MASGWMKSNQSLEKKSKPEKGEEFCPILSKEEEEAVFGDFLHKQKENPPETRKKLPAVLWIEGAGCGGELQSFLEVGEKYPLECGYFAPIMGSWGEKVYGKLVQMVKEKVPYTLIISGSIPVKEQEKQVIVSRHLGRAITARELVVRLAQDAVQVICLGTCACYGGVSAYGTENYLSAVQLLGNEKTVLLPGCPSEARHLELIFQDLSMGHPVSTDGKGFPLWWEKETIHQRCINRGCFEQEYFSQDFSQKGCRYELGCKGIATVCPRGEYEPNCIRTGGLCCGCTRKNFPE